MADIRTRSIDQLPPAGPLTGMEILPVIQGGTTAKTSVAALRASFPATPVLGTAASRDVGTTVGTVADGKVVADLNGVVAGKADVASLGNAAGRNVGTAAGTVSAGDDSRIVGALQATLLGSTAFTAAGTLTLRTLAERAADIYNIRDFGAKGDGVTDDSAALNAAIVAANLKTFYSTQHVPQPACVYGPAGKYRIVTPPARLQGAGCIMGDGANQTIFNLDASFAGDLFQWSEAWIVYGTSGPKAHGIRINGALNASAQQNALMFYDRNDNIDLADIDIWNVPGRALGFGIVKSTTNPPQAYIRESRMRAIRVFNSGAPGVPAVEFATQGTNGPDGTNEVSVSQLDIYGSNGPSLVIRNSSTKGTAARAGIIRQLKFDALRIEGTENGTAPGDLLQIGDATMSGDIGHLSFTNSHLVDPYPGYAALRVASSTAAGAGPSRIYFQGFIGGGVPAGKGLVVDNGNRIKIVVDQIRSNDTNVTVGPNVTGLHLDGNGLETTWTYSIDPTSVAGVSIPLRRSGSPLATGPAGGATSIPGTLSADQVSATSFLVGNGGLNVAGGSVTGVTFNVSSGSFTGAVGSVPSLTVDPPPAGGTPAAITVTGLGFSQFVGGGALTGSGYSVNDLLTLVGGTYNKPLIYRVATIDGSGKPLTFSSTGGGDNTGIYSALPPDVTSMTGGTGTGVTVRVAFRITSVSVTSGGLGFQTPPAVKSGTINNAGGIYTQASGTGAVSTSLPIVAAVGSVVLDGSGTSLGVAGTAGGPVLVKGALADTTGVRVTLGATYTVPANISLVRLIQATATATSTITLPTALADGQVLQFVAYAGGVNALTFSPVVNGWTNGNTLAPNTGLRIRWDATASAWYREQ